MFDAPSMTKATAHQRTHAHTHSNIEYRIEKPDEILKGTAHTTHKKRNHRKSLVAHNAYAKMKAPVVVIHHPGWMVHPPSPSNR